MNWILIQNRSNRSAFFSSLHILNIFSSSFTFTWSGIEIKKFISICCQSVTIGFIGQLWMRSMGFWYFWMYLRELLSRVWEINSMNMEMRNFGLEFVRNWKYLLSEFKFGSEKIVLGLDWAAVLLHTKFIFFSSKNTQQKPKSQ